MQISRKTAENYVDENGRELTVCVVKKPKGGQEGGVKAEEPLLATTKPAADVQQAVGDRNRASFIKEKNLI